MTTEGSDSEEINIGFVFANYENTVFVLPARPNMQQLTPLLSRHNIHLGQDLQLTDGQTEGR